MNEKTEKPLPKQLYKQFFLLSFGVYIAVELASVALGSASFQFWQPPIASDETLLIPAEFLLPMELLWMAGKGVVVSSGLVWILHRTIGRYLSALLAASRRTRKDQLVHPESLDLPGHEIADLFLAQEKMLFEIEDHQYATSRKLREVEDNLIRAAKLTATGELTSTIVHDLRNPLSAIIGYAELLEESAVDDASPAAQKNLEKVRRIKRAADHIQSLVSRMSNFVRTGLAATIEENVSLRDCIMETEMFLEHHFKMRKVSFRKNMAHADLRCWGSKQLIVQILVNLCTNAVDAMEDLSIEARIIELSVVERASDVEVSVADSGPGIPEDLVTEIFKPFFTTKGEGKGTGMGLASCMDIAELLQSKIRVSNKSVGQGAVFSFSLHKTNPARNNSEVA